MPTFKLTLAYDGTLFAGWQWQPNQRTVQGELEAAIQRITQHTVKCVASGRTDAGVHALGQVVSFACETRLDGPTLTKALNAELPEDLLVFEVAEMPPSFHALKGAIRKRYRYVVQDGRLPDLFDRKYVWHVYQRLDVEAMQAAAAALVGTHDFASYETSGSPRLTTVRTVYDLLVERRQAELTDRVVIEVEADGFLYNMVRNIAGTLVAVGKGKQPLAWPGEVLALKDRTAAGMTAPPQGLFLIGVEYGRAGE
jgi:tRNA pseudouridine38-40 synthase